MQGGVSTPPPRQARALGSGALATDRIIGWDLIDAQTAPDPIARHPLPRRLDLLSTEGAADRCPARIAIIR